VFRCPDRAAQAKGTETGVVEAGGQTSTNFMENLAKVRRSSTVALGGVECVVLCSRVEWLAPGEGLAERRGLTGVVVTK